MKKEIFSAKKKRYIFSNSNDEFNLGSLVEESQNVHNTQRALFFSLSLVFVPWFHSSLKFLQMYFNLSDSQKCNIYSKHSSSKPWSWNYSQYKKRLPKLQRGLLCIRFTYTLDEEEEDDFLHPMRIECIYSRMRSL